MWDNYIALVTVGIICVASLIGLGLYAWWCEAEDKKKDRSEDNVRKLKELTEAVEELQCDMKYRIKEIEVMVEKLEQFSHQIIANRARIDNLIMAIDTLREKINNKVEDDCK